MMPQPTPCHILDTENNTWWLPPELSMHKPDCEHQPKAAEDAPAEQTPAAPVQEETAQIHSDNIANTEEIKEEPERTWEQVLENIWLVTPENQKLTKVKEFISGLLELHADEIAKKAVYNLFRD